MKAFPLSALLLLPALATAPATAQTRTAAKPTATTAKAPVRATTTAAKPAATAAKPSTPAAKPVSAVTAPAEPAAAPKSATPQPAPAAAAKSSTNSIFVKGSTVVNLGVGLGLGYGYGYYGNIKSLPAMSLSVERGFMEGVGPGTIGIGGLIGYKGYHYDYAGGKYKSSWNNFLVSARGTYHYDLLENPKLDTYAGISLGVRVQTWRDTYYDNTPGLEGYNSSNAYVTSGIFIGGRYYFTDNIGAFSEIGYDMNYLKVGLSAKF